MRKDPEAREPMYTAVYVRLPTFAVLILRHRARRTRKSFAAIVEGLILDNILMDEVQAMVKESPDFALTAEDWFRWSITVGRTHGTKRKRRSES
jgi:hypothetical protein